jgi:hypothetical protein
VTVRSLLFSALVLGGIALGPSGAIAARAPSTFDGNWTVLIVTESGQCDRAYRYGLAIRDGRVLYEGEAAVNVAGSVSPNGAVNVRVSSGSQHADGSGRLTRENGSGKWRGAGSSGSCSGSWSAERR